MADAGRQTGMRTCVGCRAKRHRSQMKRIVAGAEGVRLDATGRMPGRGAYACSAECLQRALKNGALARALRRGIVEGELREMMEALSMAPASSGADEER